MKKIFAIALALVMVLSMASAFASACMGGFDWTCATSTNKCGQGSVEVVPYVKVNTACAPYYDFEANTCAAAVAQEHVYYALKLTVDANADDEWWGLVDLTMTYKNVTTGRTVKDPAWSVMKGDIKKNESEKAANTFYYNFVSDNWDLVTSEFEFTNAQHLDLTAIATKPSAAKVCAKLTSEKAVVDGRLAGIVGNYYVKYTEGSDAIEEVLPTITATIDGDVAELARIKYNTENWNLTVAAYDAINNVTVLELVGKKVITELSAADKDIYYNGASAKVAAEIIDFVPGVAAAAGVVNELVVMDKKAEKVLVVYTIVDGKVRTIKNTAECGYDTYDVIKAFFGLEIGTCVDKDLIKANFGWKDKVESCFSWSDKAVAAVNPDCVVAIPKTGDMSVLAWLF